MTRPTMTVAEAKERLDQMIARKLEQRRDMTEAAVAAVAARAAEIVAELEAGRFPRWPELAPLTNGERAAVYRAVVAGHAAGRTSNVD
jgi:hypothetical protein